MEKLCVHKKCKVCDEILKGRQRMFCSQSCKDKNRYSWEDMLNKRILRKEKLISLKGGCCKTCNYAKSRSGLCFHHVNPDDKKFSLQIATMTSFSWDNILIEAAKCDLLCHNCHISLHYPHVDNWQTFVSDGVKGSGNTKERQFNQYILRKRDILNSKGGGCKNCGYSKNLAVLNLHHRDSSLKSFCVDSRNLGNLSMKRISAEVEKCDVLCANCHHEHHYEY